MLRTAINWPKTPALVVVDAHALTYTRYVGRHKDVKCQAQELQGATTVEELRLHPQRVTDDYTPTPRRA